MQIQDKVTRLVRACKLYGKPYYNQNPLDMESLERVIRNFVHKLFGTKSMNNMLEISMYPDVNIHKINPDRGKYRGINVSICFPNNDELDIFLPTSNQVEVMRISPSESGCMVN